jgi:flagellar biosynthesis protein FlhB
MRSWYQRLLPTPVQLLAYLLVSLLILTIASYQQIANQLIDAGTQATIRSQAALNFDQLKNATIINSGATATVVSFIFWLAIAGLAYMIAWAGVVFIKDTFNEIEMSLIFVHPRSFSESKHWSGFATYYLLKIAALLLLAGYSLISAYVLWPALVVQFSSVISHISVSSFLLRLVPGLLLAAISLHIFVLVIRLVFWRRSADYWRYLKERY